MRSCSSYLIVNKSVPIPVLPLTRKGGMGGMDRSWVGESLALIANRVLGSRILLQLMGARVYDPI